MSYVDVAKVEDGGAWVTSGAGQDVAGMVEASTADDVLLDETGRRTSAGCAR